MNTKKVKTYHYHKEWENDYFFIMVKNKCCCLICNTSIALPKKGNVERHLRRVHNKYEIDYPQNSELRKVQMYFSRSQLLLHFKSRSVEKNSGHH